MKKGILAELVTGDILTVNSNKMSIANRRCDSKINGVGAKAIGINEAGEILVGK
jgi:hypothetical protein